MTIPFRTNWSIAQWQTHLTKMYGNVNDKRRPLETFARVTEMATGISRGVREEEKEIMKKFFPRFLAWLIGLSSQVNVDLEQAIWDSYPGVCTYCRKPKNCTCKLGPKQPRIHQTEEIDKLQAQYPKPDNLLDWVAMFARIYEGINRETGRMKMLGHFMEELGEVCEAIRFHLVPAGDLVTWKVEVSHEQIEDLLRQELSDLFAWFCGLTYHMGVELDAYMKEIYQAVCPVCINIECTCSPYRVHQSLRLGAKQNSRG
jgi:NTP pyrophosphatase (non-canonical NTP hydrolase)